MDKAEKIKAYLELLEKLKATNERLLTETPALSLKELRTIATLST